MGGGGKSSGGKAGGLESFMDFANPVEILKKPSIFIENAGDPGFSYLKGVVRGEKEAARREEARLAAEYNQTERLAQQAQDAQAQAYNRANQRRQGFSFLDSGGGGTMLTGPQGVSDDDMLLGRKSLLGGAPSVGK